MNRTFISIVTFSILFLIGCKRDKIHLPGPTEGQILISPGNSVDLTGKLLVLDKNGKILFERTTATDAHNFQKWEVNGIIRYTYLEHKADAYQIMPHAIIPCVGVILDESFKEIKRVRWYLIMEEHLQTLLQLTHTTLFIWEMTTL